MKVIPAKKTLKDFIRRGHFLYFFVYWVYGVWMDIRIGGKRLNHMTDTEHADTDVFPVQSTSYRILDQMLTEIQVSPADVFVDVGCGWGRLISFLWLNKRRCRYIGVEINERAAAVARERFKSFPNITILTGNILDHIPTDATIFFLSNPFGEALMDAFLDKIEKEVVHPVKLIYLHAVYHDTIRQRTRRWRIVRDVMLAPSHHIPVRFCVYQYTPANEIE